MKSKTLQQIKSKLRPLLKNKEVLDIILFGSAIKGKASPNDIDIAIISNNLKDQKIPGFHISVISPSDFFINPPTIITTILREGYSLKKNKPFAETLRFKTKILYTYDLTSLSNSNKVKVVNALRGKKPQEGLVENKNGEWLAQKVFTIPVDSEFLFDQFFRNFKIKYIKRHVLIH